MKKLVLPVNLIVMVFLFSMCGQKTAKNEYLVQGTVNDSDLEQIYLLYNANDSARIDSAAVVNGEFTLKGIVEKPFPATLSKTTNPKYGSIDFIRIYLEPGKIIINAGDSLNMATVNSPIHNDKRKWEEELKPITDAQQAVNEKWRSLSKEEREEQEASLTAQFDSLRNIQKDKALAFIKANPSSNYALLELFTSIVGYSPDGEEAQKVFDLFSESISSSALGTATKENIEKWKAISIGNIAPEFTQNDTIGNPVSLSSFRGKYVLIDFWASWCGPCRGENPNVVKAYNQFKDKGFTVLGVSLDNKKENWLKAIASDQLDWTQVSDLEGWGNKAAGLYAVRAIPSNFFLDPEGKIVARDLRGEALIEALHKYLD